LQQLETKRERLRANIDAISKDIARIVREKEEAESEMRKAISLKMIYGELENDVRSIQQEVDTAYGIHGPDYVGELHGKIAAEEDVLRNLKSAANAARETAQNRVDAAQMELTKWNCELSSASARIQQRKNEMEAEQRKLQKAQMSQNQIAELSQQISTVETSLSELPEMDNVRAEGLRSQRQVLQREKFNDIERDIERKKLQKDEQQQELDALMEKHSETLASAFGKVSKGPWSKAVNDMLKSMEQSNASLEKEVKICERDLDRASQALRQASINEEQLVNDVDSLRKKITELCGCTAQDVEDNLVETRLVLSKSRKELASLRTKATLYETWSEEVTKKSCCPLCERRFSSKAGAVELSGKLLDMSMSVPEEIERLERTVQEAEEKERRLVSAQNYVDQSRKIMDEKVKVARKEVGHYSKEEASLTTKLEELKEKHGKEATSYKRLLDVKADVSLMDSLFSSIRTLTEQLDELQERMDESEDNVPLSQMRRELVDKEENISSLNSELEEMQANFSERNRLTTKLHELRERRISLGEIAAQFEQIRRTVSQCRNEIDELTRRREEIMRHELPKAEEELRQAKGARDSAERSAKGQEEVKHSLIRDMRNHYNGLVALVEKLNKAAVTNRPEKLEALNRRIAECDASIIEFEKRKTGLEISFNDLEGSRAVKERDESGLEKARLKGQLEEVDKKISEATVALATKEMKQAESFYHEVVVSKIVTQEMITDLEKYMQCLDSSIIQFHSDKMIAINRILDELWRKVYGGSDIQSICIK
uniref:Zinc-hook domain-containing protein n=1 Tax=Heligmosomoides polygyrus TaxID=6339 RepID=A0A183GIS6_HELPZ